MGCCPCSPRRSCCPRTCASWQRASERAQCISIALLTAHVSLPWRRLHPNPWWCARATAPAAATSCRPNGMHSRSESSSAAVPPTVRWPTLSFGPAKGAQSRQRWTAEAPSQPTRSAAPRQPQRPLVPAGWVWHPECRAPSWMARVGHAPQSPWPHCVRMSSNCRQATTATHSIVRSRQNLFFKSQNTTS